MKITNGKDFWAGLMFIAFGLSFMAVAQNYAMGNAVRMGPAYFPTVLGGMLAVLGAVVLFRGFLSKISNPLAVFPFRLWLIVGGLILGAVAYYTQPERDAGMLAQLGHALLAGISILMLFAAFGERSLWIVLFSVVLFGYVLKPLGLVMAVFIMTIVSAVPGFAWTRKDYQWLPAYTAAGVFLTWLTLVVSPWIQHALLAVFGTVGVNLPPTLALIFVEIGLGGVLAFFAGRYKWPHLTAGHVTVLSFILAVFSVASFVHGLGLPMNVWPSLWE
jgi:putative tricarboxylic transport membrane protein